MTQSTISPALQQAQRAFAKLTAWQRRELAEDGPEMARIVLANAWDDTTECYVRALCRQWYAKQETLDAT